MGTTVPLPSIRSTTSSPARRAFSPPRTTRSPADGEAFAEPGPSSAPRSSLHSALTQHRVVGATEDEKRRIFHFELVDVVVAMSIAGLINRSMLAIAASVFHAQGLAAVGDDLSEVYETLGSSLGEHADVLFGIALLASGLSSSSVVTMSP